MALLKNEFLNYKNEQEEKNIQYQIKLFHQNHKLKNFK